MTAVVVRQDSVQFVGMAVRVEAVILMTVMVLAEVVQAVEKVWKREIF